MTALKLWQKRSFASAVLIACIVAGLLIGTARPLGRMADEVEALFYYGENGDGYCIRKDLEERAISATNMVTVASRYLDSGNTALTTLRDAINALSAAKTIGDKYDANEALTAAAAGLVAELGKLELSEKDAKYISGLRTELQSRNDTISRNGYNAAALDYNSLLERFPTRVLAGVLSIDKMEYFR